MSARGWMVLSACLSLGCNALLGADEYEVVPSTALAVGALVEIDLVAKRP